MPLRKRAGQRKRGRRGRRIGEGPGSSCVCPKCGARVPYQPGVVCGSRPCPQCGAQMRRAP